MDDKWGTLLNAMERRMGALDDIILRDFNGGLSTALGKWSELKYWKEAIERGEFDEVVHDSVHQ